MNDMKDLVWREFRGELRRHRVRRRAARALAVTALLWVAAWWGRGFLPQPPVGPAIVVEPAPILPVHAEPPNQLAVLVHDGLGLRLELVDAAEMSDTELSLSLEPVVWNGQVW